MEWFVVTWLRYTVWIPLYPLGFMMEGMYKDKHRFVCRCHNTNKTRDMLSTGNLKQGELIIIITIFTFEYIY